MQYRTAKNIGRAIKAPFLLTLDPPESKENLKQIAGILNERPSLLNPKDHLRLIQLVEIWEKASNWDREVWRQHGFSEPDLRNRINGALPVEWVLPTWCDERARLTYSDGRFAKPTLPDDAFFWFARLVTDLECAWWGGRCKRCEKFYVKNRLNQTSYCSRNCSSRATSRKRKLSSAEEQLNSKLIQVQQAIAKYEALPSSRRSKSDWKSTVAGIQGDCTVSWITRYINLGKLRPPATTTAKSTL